MTRNEATPTTADFQRWLKRRSAGGNWFLCFDDYLDIMSHQAAWAIQRIINSGKTRPKNEGLRQELWDKGWILVTARFLEKKVRLSPTAQHRVLRELQGYETTGQRKTKGGGKGTPNEELAFVKVKCFGVPRRRYVKVDLLKIEVAIDKAQQKNTEDEEEGKPSRLDPQLLAQQTTDDSPSKRLKVGPANDYYEEYKDRSKKEEREEAASRPSPLPSSNGHQQNGHKDKGRILAPAPDPYEEENKQSERRQFNGSAPPENERNGHSSNGRHSEPRPSRHEKPERVKLSDGPTPDQECLDAAKTLREALQRNNRQCLDQDKGRANAFRLLRDHDKQDFAAVLKGFCAHCSLEDERHYGLPEITSGAQFRKHFGWIRRSLEKHRLISTPRRFDLNGDGDWNRISPDQVY